MLFSQILLAYTMFFTSYNASILPLHRAYPFYDVSCKYSITTGYTAFKIPYAHFSMDLKGLYPELFLLSSGKMDRTDAQGNITGSFYYNAVGLAVGKEILNSSREGRLFVKPAVYLETSDGWYNPGFSVSFYYTRSIYKRLSMYFVLRDLGISFNPVEPINFRLDYTVFYSLKEINPYITFEYTPYGGIDFWSGLGLPLHKKVSVFAGYTSKYNSMKFGGGNDILNGLFMGVGLKPGFITLNYFVDFYGEGGITHNLEVRISR